MRQSSDGGFRGRLVSETKGCYDVYFLLRGQKVEELAVVNTHHFVDVFAPVHSLSRGAEIHGVVFAPDFLREAAHRVNCRCVSLQSGLN